MRVLTDDAEKPLLPSSGTISEPQDKSNDLAKETPPLINDSSNPVIQNTTSSDKTQGKYILIDSS